MNSNPRLLIFKVGSVKLFTLGPKYVSQKELTQTRAESGCISTSPKLLDYGLAHLIKRSILRLLKGYYWPVIYILCMCVRWTFIKHNRAQSSSGQIPYMTYHLVTQTKRPSIHTWSRPYNLWVTDLEYAQRLGYSDVWLLRKPVEAITRRLGTAFSATCPSTSSLATIASGD